ncbi:MAG TPA: HD domain-containing protein [Candidatus Saccharimonadales bacterium]|jgi:putative hydrolase of HD superfamily|nr:HD domain-containing protein [Candidatus Saccharimonadales bacterium]
MNTTPQPDIQRILDLQKMLVTFAGIERKVAMPPKAEIPESDVEHSFSIAIICWFLAPQFPELDASKLLSLCLAHDFVEVYCGDTFSFDSEAVSDQQERERKAFGVLKKDWHDFPALIESIAEYEERKTAEAKFVVAVDRFHPVLMDYLTEGRTWHKLGITFEKLMAVKDKELATSEVGEYYDQLKGMMLKNQHLFPDA